MEGRQRGDDRKSMIWRSARHRRFVLLGLALAVTLDTALGLTWKAAAMRLPAVVQGWRSEAVAVLHQPLFAAVLLIFILQFFNWMAVLAESDISFAQPITALSIVTVSVLSVIFYHDRISAAHGAGVALILAGVWLIGTTPIQTTAPETQPAVDNQTVPERIHEF